MVKLTILLEQRKIFLAASSVSNCNHLIFVSGFKNKICLLRLDQLFYFSNVLV